MFSCSKPASLVLINVAGKKQCALAKLAARSTTIVVGEALAALVDGGGQSTSRSTAPKRNHVTGATDALEYFSRTIVYCERSVFLVIIGSARPPAPRAPKSSARHRSNHPCESASACSPG